MYNDDQYGINEKIEKLTWGNYYSEESIKQNERLMGLADVWEDEYEDLYEYIVDHYDY